MAASDPAATPGSDATGSEAASADPTQTGITPAETDRDVREGLRIALERLAQNPDCRYLLSGPGQDAWTVLANLVETPVGRISGGAGIQGRQRTRDGRE